ncbi:uncharacterized protein [Equus przewalskii]|uniref:Uncharacterized protein n=1 Tax=Equus przewalskii TaxID=9798 RepID=A0ABM4LL44_EQUPR
MDGEFMKQSLSEGSITALLQRKTSWGTGRKARLHGRFTPGAGLAGTPPGDAGTPRTRPPARGGPALPPPAPRPGGRAAQRAAAPREHVPSHSTRIFCQHPLAAAGRQRNCEPPPERRRGGDPAQPRRRLSGRAGTQPASCTEGTRSDGPAQTAQHKRTALPGTRVSLISSVYSRGSCNASPSLCCPPVVAIDPPIYTALANVHAGNSA